jgi:hypothetical protein
MALESTQLPKEKCTRNLHEEGKADSLITIYEPLVKKIWEPRHLKPCGPLRHVTRIALLV